MDRIWRRCRAGIIRVVRFAISDSVVELIECFDYRCGRVYRVRDVATGREDLVGVEFILRGR